MSESLQSTRSLRVLLNTNQRETQTRMKPHTVPFSALTAEPSRGSAVDGVAFALSAQRSLRSPFSSPSRPSAPLRCALTLLTLLWVSAGCTPLEFGDPSNKLECLEHNDCGAAQRCVEGVCERLSREVCDGLDNDYDGQTDEGLLNACGECGSPPREVCDELDNDCDGVVDEGFESKGMTCSPDPSNPNIIGEWLCLNEELKCIPSQLSRPEECNGEDDDLDGAVDEGLSFNPISCSLGSCRPSSTPRCEAGVVVSGCEEASAESDRLIPSTGSQLGIGISRPSFKSSKTPRSLSSGGSVTKRLARRGKRWSPR